MTWSCTVCDQEVDDVGPWCMLYCDPHLMDSWCRPLVKRELAAAHNRDDLAAFHALIRLGRAKWGEDDDW